MGILLLVIEVLIYRFLKKARTVKINLYHKIDEKDTDIFDDSLKNTINAFEEALENDFGYR